MAAGDGVDPALLDPNFGLLPREQWDATVAHGSAEDGPPDSWFVDPVQAAAEEAWRVRLEASPMPEGMSVRVIHGTEGPRNDPHSFTEYRVTMPWGVVITYHSGLDEWMRVGAGPHVVDDGWNARSAPLLRFEALVGFDLDQLDWWGGMYDRGSAPCMACARPGCGGGCAE